MSLEPIGPIAAAIVADARFRRLAIHLHALGPRAVAEFIAEYAATVDPDRAVLLAILERYGALTPETLAAVGADKFPDFLPHQVTT